MFKITSLFEKKTATIGYRFKPYMNVLLAISLLAIASAYFIVREYEHQTGVALNRREAIADLGALLIHEKLDGIINVGSSLVLQTRICQSIEKGDWNVAIKDLEEIPGFLPYIDTISFFDRDGVLKAITPPTPEIIGKNFAYRDYYQGVSKEWKPYVSSAFTSVIAPRHSIITVSIPVRSPDQEVIGILVFAVKLGEIVKWIGSVDVGPGGLAYVVDKNGQLIAHTNPNIDVDGSLIDYSSVITVQKLLRGEHGVEVIFNSIENEERVTAYASVQKYGFGIVVAQPINIAFADRKKQIIETGVIYALIIFFMGILYYRMLKDENEIGRQRDRERILLGSIGDGVVSIDRNWNVVTWNKAMTSLSGYSEQEVMGKSFREFVKLIRKNDRKEDVAFIEEVMLYKKPVQMGDNMLLIAKDKAEVPVGDTAAPILDEGDISGVVIIIRNATKEKEAQMIKSDFAYASHQLRTPVSKALWSLESAIHEKSIKRMRDGVLVAYKSLQSTQKLANELIEVSTIDQDMIVIQKKPVRITDVFEESRKSLELKLENKGIDLAMPLISVSASIETDQKLLSRAIYEIIENAVLYSPEKSRIMIELIMNAENIIIIVSDNGIGIPEEQQALIFTKFFRGRNIDTTNIMGGGLGLYIAQQYINLLGGKIWFESEENKGTKVFVSLPIK